MTSKIVKEAIIILLACLVVILLFAVILYNFIPNRKLVKEVKQYQASEQISEQLSDKVDAENEQVVLTYEVTKSDLNNYKITDDYVPGKANPFSELTTKEQEASKLGNSSKSGNSGKSTGSGSSSSSAETGLK